jgi:hypothetical protein
MTQTAYIETTGLRGLYIGFLLSRPDAFTVIAQFLSTAGAYEARFGGDQNGDEVFFHYRPTGLKSPAAPCEPMEWWSCWPPKGWKPPINRPVSKKASKK